MYGLWLTKLLELWNISWKLTVTSVSFKKLFFVKVIRLS